MHGPSAIHAARVGLSVNAARASGGAVAAVRSLAADLGIPPSLREYGLREEHVERVVAEAMKSGNVAVNPRGANAEDLAGILRQAL